MRILFVTTDYYLPERVGGSQISTHQLCLECLENGVQPFVLASRRVDGVQRFLVRARAKLPVKAALADTRFGGYSVLRCWNPVSRLRDVIRFCRPHVAVVQAGDQRRCVDALLELDVPTIRYLRDSSFERTGPAAGARGRFSVIANSKYLARTYEQALGTCPHVIPPLVRPGDFRLDRRRNNSVLLVSPHPSKGVDVALQLAERNPQIRFDFVWGWSVEREVRAYIENRAERAGNVRIYGPLEDMRTAYGNAKIVLVPSGTPFRNRESTSVEAWGRVVTEAHVNGIPAIATNYGGLPESVGPGGILVDRHAPIEEWEQALRTLWYDEDAYQEMSRQALEYSRREAISPERLFRQFVGICRATAAP